MNHGLFFKYSKLYLNDLKNDDDINNNNNLFPLLATNQLNGSKTMFEVVHNQQQENQNSQNSTINRKRHADDHQPEEPRAKIIC